MIKILIFICITSLGVFAAIPAEVPALDSVMNGSGTRLVSMPTYVYGRAQGQGGGHGEDELWAPDRAGERHLPNRYSQILNWNAGAPSLWFSTGNEVGDLLYQELLDDTHGSNRTPLLDGGFTSPSWNGFWVTGQGSQVDHYSSETLSERTRRNGDMSFAWFGENLPAFSTAFAGMGYRTAQVEAELLTGSDFVWVQSRTRRWVPLQIKPRVQGHVSQGRASLDIAYEKQEFGDQVWNTTATKTEFTGTLRMSCPRECQLAGVVLGGGMAFRHEQDSGSVPWGLHNRSTVFWPWLEISVKLMPKLRWAGYAGINEKDQLVRDSLEYSGRKGAWVYQAGWLNSWGTTMDPLAYDYEYYQGDTLNLEPITGHHNTQKIYAHLQYIRTEWTLQTSAWNWAQHGAETFVMQDSLYDNQQWLRQGQVQRIDAWLGGLGASAGFAWRLDNWFQSGMEAGFEHFWGPTQRMETTPAQGFAKLRMAGLFKQKLRIEHEWIYRSASSWNHEVDGPLSVEGGWNWNASIEQMIPEYDLTLQATWQHVLASDKVQAPYGGRERTRFYCGMRKDF